jgi:4-amino-4-deoxy-L-arabinose transferase-like glycosyltransferase
MYSNATASGLTDSLMQISEVQADVPAVNNIDPHSAAFWRRKLFWIVLIGFLFRVASVGIGHTYRVNPIYGTFGYGWEMGRIGQSLAEGKGFSDPFRWQTGPTAWEPPAYPFLIAGVFKIFGVYTRLSAFVLLTINCFFSALTCVPIFYLARRSLGWKIAKWSAWSWSLVPYAAYWAVKWIWDTSITLCLLTTLVLMSMRLAEGRRIREWIAWGALWGLGAFLNPSILSLLPFMGLWIVWQLARDRKPWLAQAVVAAIVFWACITPWLIRNYHTFGQPVFLRTNFGAEFRMGNGPGADGTWMSYIHPTHNLVEFAKYKQMGEIAYVHMRKQEALDWIKADPVRFAKVTFARFIYYWVNVPSHSRIMPLKNWLFLASSVTAFWGLFLMRKQRRPGWQLYASALLVYPLVYYFVFPHPRYRAPIEPLITILIVFLFAQTSTLRKRHPDLT